MKKIFLSLVLSTFIVGCSNPKDEVLPPNLTEADMTALAENVKSLNEEDKALLTGYIMRSEMSKAFGGEGASTGTTVGEAIENQKQWVTQQQVEEQAKDELATKLKAEKDAKAAEFEKSVAVTVFDKGMIKEDFQSFMTVDMSIKNNSDKEVAGLKGNINFFDKFGDLVISLSFGDDKLDIPAGDSIEVYFNWTYNEYIAHEKQFINTDMADMTYKFEASQILFEDGTKLEMPITDDSAL